MMHYTYTADAPEVGTRDEDGKILSYPDRDAFGGRLDNTINPTLVYLDDTHFVVVPPARMKDGMTFALAAAEQSDATPLATEAAE